MPHALRTRRHSIIGPPRSLALVLRTSCLWSADASITCGLGGDARLYAVQALAGFIRTCSTICILRNTSQDSLHAIFEPLRAMHRPVGLRNAALTLTIALQDLVFRRRVGAGPPAFRRPARLPRGCAADRHPGRLWGIRRVSLCGRLVDGAFAGRSARGHRARMLVSRSRHLGLADRVRSACSCTR